MMFERPTPDNLSELGESLTNVANAWGGAEDYLTRGLVQWLKQNMPADQKAAVKAAVDGCRLVIERYPTTGADTQAPKQYLDDMLAKVTRWIDNPSNNNKEAVRSSLDITRQLHAWHGSADIEHFWILEAVDHASLAVWANERSSYIITLDIATCVSRSLACAFRAMVLSGTSVDHAVDAITGVLLPD